MVPSHIIIIAIIIITTTWHGMAYDGDRVFVVVRGYIAISEEPSTTIRPLPMYTI